MNNNQVRARMEGGIAYIEMPAGILDKHSFVAFVEALRPFMPSDGSKLHVIGSGKVRGITYPAARYCSGPDMHALVQSLTIVVQNSLERNVASFFMHIVRTRYPIKLAADFDEARAIVAQYQATDD